MNPLDGQDETEIDPTSMDLTDCIEGVRLDELLELCLAALQVMAKDAAAQTELVHTAGFLTIVVQVSPMNLLQGVYMQWTVIFNM